MAKIGILTFSNTLNYGAALQCFALSKYLQSIGHTVSVFDYRNQKIELSGKRRLGWVKTPKQAVLWLLTHSEFGVREKLFDEFNSNYLNFVPCADADQLEQYSADFDFLFVGSDQVWNYCITGSDNTFFFPFESKKALKISFSASFGRGGITDSDWKQIAEYVQDFHAIGVRESSGSSLLLENTGVESSVTIDPTLLLERDSWKAMVGEPLIEGEYVLAYVLSQRENVTHTAMSVGKQMGIPTICLQTGSIHSTKGALDIKNAGPLDYLNYFAHAKYVVTDSFHGTCFSLIFEKNFSSLLGLSEGANSRIVDLLDSLGVSQRYREVSLEPICYRDVNEKLDALVLRSREFIAKSIG